MTEYFWVGASECHVGDVIEPGGWGSRARQDGVGGFNFDALSRLSLAIEIAAEVARRYIRPFAPSRANCIFAWERLEDAQFFLGKRQGCSIFKVVSEPNFYRGDYDVITNAIPDTPHFDQVIDRAIRFWKEIPNGRVEVLIGGSAKITEKIS